MNKFISKIIGASLAIAMMVGGAVGINAAKEAKEVNAIDSWNQVTALSQISNNDEIMIVNADYYLPAVNFAAKNSGGASFDIEDPTLANPVWKVLVSNSSYKFTTVVNETTYYLYVTNDNNGVVSGSGNTPAGKSWSITKHATANTFMLTSSDGSNTRYLTYASGNFRCYKTSGNTGDKYCTLYKKAATKTLSSIAVATAPTKTTYYAGDHFDPTGLVITRTYSDSTSDTYTYANHASDFTFTPNTSSELTIDNTSVTIGYGGKTTTQAITVNAARTMSSIELHGTIAKTEYYVGDTWDLDGLDIQVNWSEGNPTFVDLDDENVLYECSPATAENTSLISFNIHVLYDNFDEIFPVNGLTVTEHPLADVLNTTTVPAAAIGNTTSAWGTWTEVTDYTYSLSTTNGAKYQARLMGPGSNEYIGRMNDSTNGGFYTSKAPVGVRIKTIAFSSMASSKNVSVYLQNEAYASLPSSADYKTTLTSTNLSYTVEGNYCCFAIRGRSGSLDVGALTIEYEEITPSMSASPSSITLSSNGTQNVEITVANYTSLPTLECNIQSGASSIASAIVGAVNSQYKATATITATNVSGNAVVRVRDAANPDMYYADINVSVQTAKDVVENTVTTSSSLSYRYNRSGAVIDTLDKDFTGLTDGSYANWSDKQGTSGAVYGGNSYGSNEDYIQLKSKDGVSGIVTTTSGGLAKKVSVVWGSGTQVDRTLDIYGKNTAYETAADLYGTSKGTKLGSIVYGTSTSFIINGDYEYIGIRSYDGGIYLESVSIQWGDYTYTYSDISMRFGGSISKTLWSELDTNEHLIEGVGVMITGYEENMRSQYLIKDHVADAVSYDSDYNIKTQLVDCYVTLNEFGSLPEKDNNYYWNFKQPIDSYDDILDDYTAAAYIKLTNGDLVFMQQVKYSVWSLAKDYLDNRNCNEETAGGSLYHLYNDLGME